MESNKRILQKIIDRYNDFSNDKLTLNFGVIESNENGFVEYRLCIIDSLNNNLILNKLVSKEINEDIPERIYLNTIILIAIEGLHNRLK